MLKELRKIFDYYKKEHKLKTKLLFNNNKMCAFHIEENWISYDLTFVIEKVNNHIIEQLIKQYNTGKKIIPIYALLHELGHAVDRKYKYEQYKKEAEQTNRVLYMTNYDYAISQPFEIRADKFAIKELKKWIT